MKLYNKSGNGLQHVVIEEIKRDGEVIKSPKTYTLSNGGVADIPKEVADKWLKISGVEKYIEPEDLEKAAKEAEEKAEAEKLALLKENEDLKKQIQKLTKDLKKAAKEAEEKA